MARLGSFNTLTIEKHDEHGLWLDGGELGEVFLPSKFVPEDCEVGDELDVFVYEDADRRVTATTQKPQAYLGEYAFLSVVGENEHGVFLDCGLPKDIFLPRKEQTYAANVGDKVLAKIILDRQTQRLMATMRIDKMLEIFTSGFEEKDKVKLLIAKQTDLGLKAIVNQQCWGVLHASDVHKQVKVGDSVTGYIKTVREDGKIDLMLELPGYQKIDDKAQAIVRKLSLNNGFLPLNDKSEPDLIKRHFGISKRVFKQAIGALYKARIIEIQDDGIRLIKPIES